MAKKTTKKATTKSQTDSTDVETTEETKVSRSPAAEKDKALTKSALKLMGKEMREARGRAPFSIPKNGDEIIERATSLSAERDAGEMELSALLYEAQDKELATVYGFSNLSELAQEKMGISGSKARTLATNYSYFISLGLEPKLFSGKNSISYSKFKEIIKLVKNEAVTSRNIDAWLPLLMNNGPTALPLRDIQKRVKEELMKVAGGDEDEGPTMRKLAFEVPADQLEHYNDILETLKESMGVDSDSAAILRSIQQAASAQIEDATGQVAYMGLSGLCKMMANTAPVIPIILPIDENVTYENVGVPVVSTLYFAMKAGDARACVATSKEAAAKALGVSITSVREMPYVIADDVREGLPEFQGTFGVGGPDLDDVEEADPEAMVEEEPEAEVEETVEEAEETEAYAIDDTWIDTVVTANYKGEEIEGTIVKVDTDKETVAIKVEGARGRPKAVAFADVLSIVESEEEETAEEEEAESDDSVTELSVDEAEEEIETEDEEEESQGDLLFDEETEETEASAAPEFDVEDTAGMTTYVMSIGKALSSQSAEGKKRAAAIQKQFGVLQKKHAGKPNAKGLAFHELVGFAHEQATEAGLDIDALT